MSMKKMLAVVAAASLVAVAAPAFAANPFSDVPMNHWAYDAVEELTAKGVLEGYPNGTFRGNRPMTRYEIATMVARLMNAGLTGEDLERLKALVVEFQPELEALGVKVDDLDSRVASLEKGLKGWKISGQMRFDYHGWDTPEEGGGKSDNGFSMDRARLFLHRDMDNGLSFDARVHANKIDRYWLTARDFMGLEGLTLELGSFFLDWEGEDGLYLDNDAFFMDGTFSNAAHIKYSKGMFEIQGFYADAWGTYDKGVYTASTGGELYGARVKFNFGEKFWLSGNGLGYHIASSKTTSDYANLDADNQPTTTTTDQATDLDAYWVALGINLTPGITLRGGYWWEDITSIKGADPTYADDPAAYRISVDVKQDVLKFTSLAAEYAHMDEGFYMTAQPWTYDDTVGANSFLAGIADQQLVEDMDVIFVKMQQQWTPKWKTILRYVNIDGDLNGDATEWGIAIGYQYSPALYFELGYEDMDGQIKSGAVNEDYDNNQIRFRTLFNF